jgi:SAM-dependent methyltransferase
METRRTQKFFNLPYLERVNEIKRIYSHARMRSSFDRYFETRVASESYSSPYFDIIAAYARELNVQTALQVGCFTCQDSIFLAHSGFKGRQVASDFDADRLEYMKLRLAQDPACHRIEFERLDIETATAAAFNGIDLVFALAVLSNIQPEGMERLFMTIASSSVKVCVFGDIYRPQSLTRVAGAQSMPSSSRNWFHPFLSLAERHGMDGIFIPGFSDNELRGIFIVHKDISSDINKAAVGSGVGHYVVRQRNIKFDR